MSDVRCQRSARLIVIIRCQLFVNRYRTEGSAEHQHYLPSAFTGADIPPMI